MTLAKSITRSCPYNCGETIEVLNPIEGFQLMTCPRCQKPWVMQTTMVPFVQVRTVEGYGITTATLPTPEEIEEDAKYYKEHPEELASVQDIEDTIPTEQTETSSLDTMPWLSCPGSPRCKYRHDGEYVEMKYIRSKPMKTTWIDIHMLCEEEHPTASIKELIGTDNSKMVAAVNAFVRAVKRGKVSE